MDHNGWISDWNENLREATSRTSACPYSNGVQAYNTPTISEFFPFLDLVKRSLKDEAWLRWWYDGGCRWPQCSDVKVTCNFNAPAIAPPTARLGLPTYRTAMYLRPAVLMPLSSCFLVTFGFHFESDVSHILGYCIHLSLNVECVYPILGGIIFSCTNSTNSSWLTCYNWRC